MPNMTPTSLAAAVAPRTGKIEKRECLLQNGIVTTQITQYTENLYSCNSYLHLLLPHKILLK